MNPDYLQLGGVFIIAMALIRIIERLIVLLVSKMRNGNGGKKDSKQDVEIAIIKTQLTEIMDNHLVHIDEDLKKNTEEHRSMSIKLASIETKLQILIDK